MDQFPQMLYRLGGSEPAHGGYFATRIVGDTEELVAALAEGWAESTPDAVAAAAAPPAPPPAVVADDTPPTRAELEQKAIELGIKFSPRIGDEKLAERIAAKMAASDAGL